MEKINKITKDIVQNALNKGFPITCATCRYLYKGLNENKEDCGKSDCGGPLSGKGFPLYDGQITKTNFPNICLICGDNKVTHLILVNDNDKFGLCDQHHKIYDSAFNPVGMFLKPTIIKFS